MQISQLSLLLLCVSMSSANAFSPHVAGRVKHHHGRGTFNADDSAMKLSMFLQSPPDYTAANNVAVAAAATAAVATSSTTSNILLNGIQNFLLPPPAFAADININMNNKPPTNDEIKLLREALGALYGERNPEKAMELLTKAIAVWERQPPDERAALFRVRGDCYMVRCDYL